MTINDKLTINAEELDRKYKKLLERRTNLQSNQVRIEAELSSRKRQLKETMNECRSQGFDPDTLEADTKRLREVVAVKLDTFAADIEASEEMMKPLLNEVG